MTNNELMQLAEMFDTIVNSENPAVQRSLQHTALLATLAEEKQNMEGPFLKMFKTVNELREDMQRLKRSVQILENNSRTEPYYSASPADYNNMGALTTAQITALTGTAVSLGDVTLTPIDINSWNLNNNINIIKFDNGTT